MAALSNRRDAEIGNNREYQEDIENYEPCENVKAIIGRLGVVP